MKVTEQQQLILDYDDSAVVIAAPGSGKTFVLSEKIKINLKGLANHQGIIAISYTNKASNELKSRSLSNGENPKSSFFGTIDKFNLSEIIIPFGEHLFGISNKDIQIKKINSVGDAENPFDWFDRRMTLADINENQFNVVIDYFNKGIIMIETIGILADYVFINSLACRNYIKSRYKYIYIDEYQDSGFEQHEIFLKIKQLGIKAVAVGDLNQSIYAFSGKDAKFLEELTQNEDFKYFKLDKNHRCDPSIINYSNYLLNPKTELIPVEHNLVFFHRVDGNEIAVAAHIDDLIENIESCFGIKKRSQIAILTRTTRTGEIINNMMQQPHKLSVANNLDNNLNIWSAIFSNLLHFIFDSSFQFIDVVEVFTSYDRFKKNELKSIARIKDNLENIAKADSLDIDALLEEFIAAAQIIAPNSKNQESIDLLKEVLNNKMDLKSYEPAREDEINILTVHKSKGLEYDVVIHLDLYKWIFPSMGPGNGNDWNNPVYHDWKQDLNLHYVGITRARKGCFLVSSTQRTNNQNQNKRGEDSQFLWHEGIDSLRFQDTKSDKAIY